MDLFNLKQPKYSLDEIQRMMDNNKGTLVFWANDLQVAAAKSVLRSQAILQAKTPGQKALFKVWALLMDLNNQGKVALVVSGKGEMAVSYLLRIQEMLDESKRLEPALWAPAPKKEDEKK